MPLLEHEVQRIAKALDDYDEIAVADIGGTDERGFWVVVYDGRLGRRCEIATPSDYWNFVTAFVRSVPAANSTAEMRQVVS